MNANMIKMLNFISAAVLLLFLSNCDSQAVTSQQESDYELPPCRSCRLLTDSFNKSLQTVQKSGKSYQGNTMFDDIVKMTCSDGEHKKQCYSLVNENHNLLSDWWIVNRFEHPNIYRWLCIDTLKSCCPDLHYGAECTPCPGYPDRVCFNNGKCRGAGTRKGKGKCLCDVGYTGGDCSDCAENYYEAYRDENKLLCTECHVSCLSSCTQAGSKGCVACSPGWLMDVERGCLDVNECVHNVCTSSQFCVNTEGSYTCLECDRSCRGCTGDGPDMCLRCADGYTKEENFCVDAEQRNRKKFVTVTRYLTYFGLCVATCIILQHSIIAAACVGLAVGIYISFSEIMLKSESANENRNTMLDMSNILQTIT